MFRELLPRRMWTALVIVLVWGSASVAGSAQCYFPSGQVAHSDMPCNPSARHSACCGPQDICLDNGLCYDQSSDGLMSRGSCTDKSWKDDSCSQYCANESIQSGCAVMSCAYGEWCCEPGCCGNVTVPLFAVKVGTVLGRPTDIANPTTATAMTVTKTTTPTSSSVVTITTTPSSSPHASSSRDIAIGAGVGVPLGLALLGAVGLLFYRERQHRRTYAVPSSPSPYNHHAQPYEMNPVGLVEADSIPKNRAEMPGSNPKAS